MIEECLKSILVFKRFRTSHIVILFFCFAIVYLRPSLRKSFKLIEKSKHIVETDKIIERRKNFQKKNSAIFFFDKRRILKSTKNENVARDTHRARSHNPVMCS